MTNEQLLKIAISELQPIYDRIDDIALYNQNKVLKAYQNNQIALRHMSGSSGYGYEDVGRPALSSVFADIFHTEAAIVTPNLVSGTHALSVVLFGILRPNDLLLSITGQPYDTMRDVINGVNIGSLKDFGVKYDEIGLIDGDFDYEAIERYIKIKQPRLVLIQRSRGYEWRPALSIDKIEKAIKLIKSISKADIFVDNCYGEFMTKTEPTDVGADVMAGSLIKNIGGGIAPTGGYIVGRQDLIKQIEGRITSPSIGMEVGSYVSGYLPFFQGLFLAPHTVAQAVKTAVTFSATLQKLGYEVLPNPTDDVNDIVCSIKFNDKNKLIAFCQAIQRVSPIDSFVVPEPWDMPGYNDQVIMAAGCFVQGASIELSCDAPIREPYIGYLQGSLTFEHGKIAILECLNAIRK